MAIASLTLWLENPSSSYAHGLILYEQYGSSSVTLALLKSGNGSYHHNKLRAVLLELNQQENLVAKPIVVLDYVPEPSTIHGKGQFDYETAPERIIEVRDKKNHDYAQARRLHEGIRYIDDVDLRLQAGLELLDRMDAVDTAWSVLDLYAETGEIQKLQVEDQAAEVALISLAKLHREEKNLESNISKDKRRIKEAKDEKDKIRITLRLEQRVSRLNLVRDRIKAELH